MDRLASAMAQPTNAGAAAPLRAIMAPSCRTPRRPGPSFADRGTLGRVMGETHLRFATAADAAAVAAIYAPYVRDTAISFEVDPPAADEMRARIADVQQRHAWLVACRGNDVVGYAYAGAHRTRAAYRWSVDTAVYLERGSHRRGIARRLYATLFALLVRQGYVNAYAGITLPNPASVGFHEAMGFAPLGVYRGVGYKKGAWYDVGWWSRRLRDCAGDPGEPLALGELDPDAVGAVLASG
jgi:L-amino acid N-acyltransferase YncA